MIHRLNLVSFLFNYFRLLFVYVLFRYHLFDFLFVRFINLNSELLCKIQILYYISVSNLYLCKELRDHED